MVEEAGAGPYFMGTELQAQFVGHGLGLQINELPVLMGRSKDTLQPGMIIAFEPKFVLPPYWSCWHREYLSYYRDGYREPHTCS